MGNALMHASLTHLLANLALVAIFAPSVWRVLGTAHMISLLVAAQTTGMLAQRLSDTLIADPRPLLGTSAIGYGLIAAYGLIYPCACPLPLSITGHQIALVTTVCTLILMILASHSTVAHAAHLGGMVGAALVLKAREVTRKTT